MNGIASVGFAALIVFAGCSAPPPPAPASVRGKVLTAAKKPAAGVIVRFWAQPNHAGSADSVTQADGSFEMKCVPGKYDITLMAIPSTQADPVAAPTPKSSGPPSASKVDIPARMKDLKDTPWRDIEIPAAGRDTLELVIVE